MCARHKFKLRDTVHWSYLKIYNAVHASKWSCIFTVRLVLLIRMQLCKLTHIHTYVRMY